MGKPAIVTLGPSAAQVMTFRNLRKVDLRLIAARNDVATASIVASLRHDRGAWRMWLQLDVNVLCAAAVPITD